MSVGDPVKAWMICLGFVLGGPSFTVMATSMAIGADPSASLDFVRERNAPYFHDSTAHARFITNMLIAEGATEKLTARVHELIERDGLPLLSDPYSGNQVDALRSVKITRGPSGYFRRDLTFSGIYVRGGHERVETTLWTPNIRVVQSFQGDERAVMNELTTGTFDEFMASLALGRQPWAVTRILDGGYAEAVDLGTSLLAQAPDAEIAPVDASTSVIRSSSSGIELYFAPVSGRVSMVRLPSPSGPSRQHRFVGDLPSPAGFALHPRWWLHEITGQDGEPDYPLPSHRYESVLVGDRRPALPADHFEWPSFARRVEHAVTHVVYRPDGTVDDELTNVYGMIADPDTKPVELFRVIDTPDGPVVTSIPKAGISSRLAAFSFGGAFVVVGAVAWLRGRAA